MGILLWIVVGAALGSIAKWVMPGPDPAGKAGSILLGIGAAALGGTLSTVAGGTAWSGQDPRSLLLATISSLIMLLAYRSYAMRWAA
jgi:uncharacterized membrane protein YeaQ/YmgE (transglycosylase-associated protein family)